jgi:glutamate racemase
VTTQACPRFVEFVEAGVTSGPELLAVAREYLAPVVAADVDTLVLGCTHYPLLTGVLSYVAGEGVSLVSSAEETAQAVYRELVQRDAVRPDGLPDPEHRFLTTGDPAVFTELARRFLGTAAPASLRAERHTTALTTASIPVVPLAGPRAVR